MWRKADPEFAPESLRLAGVAPAFRGDVQPLKAFYPPPEEEQPVFNVLSARSSDNRYKLIFDWYQHIEEVGEDEIDIGGDADSGPLLLDFLSGTAKIFEVCGTPCKYDWGVWLSPKRFALVRADTEPRFRATIAVYSLGDSTVNSYETQPVSSTAYASYRAAWESWVASRFRALKKKAPPS
jgi:hypothetical protein